MKQFFVLLILLGFLHPSASTAQERIVVSFSTGILTVYDGNRSVMQTPVVLPKGNYYPLPSYGTVTAAVIGPKWSPTPRMLKTGKFKASYSAFEKGNAMGRCKISINFDIHHRVLQYVRIHGNAEPKDLKKRESSGCIRMPDSFCDQIVSRISGTSARVALIP